MNVEKKYYWIKIKDSFMTSDKVDYIMSQPNGASYIVIYQMLCLKCINTNGELSRTIGEVIIPFDSKKIARDLKYFDIDVIEKALIIFKALGMIYQEENGYLRIAEFENMVGAASTDEHTRKLNAERQSKFRLNHKNDSESVTVTQEVTEDVTLFRNAEIDIRDRDKEIDIYSHTKQKPEGKTKNKKFIAPSLDEVKSYIQEKHYSVDASKFYDYYEEMGWCDIKGNPVKNWKGKIVTWESRDKGGGRKNVRPAIDQPDDESLRELEEIRLKTLEEIK